MRQPDPLTLLAAAVAGHPRGKAGVAAQLQVSRPLLSRVLSPTDRLAARIIATFGVTRCPATGEQQQISDCQRLAALPAPTHNPQAMRHWKCCQHCPHRPLPLKGEKC